jgi:hypothetical protein
MMNAFFTRAARGLAWITAPAVVVGSCYAPTMAPSAPRVPAVHLSRGAAA